MDGKPPICKCLPGSPIGPALSSFVGVRAFLETWDVYRQFPPTLVTLDVSFQVFNVLVLSGMVGSIPMNLETLQRLAELSGFGLASARVAFPGHISRSASDCVVSFPGKRPLGQSGLTRCSGGCVLTCLRILDRRCVWAGSACEQPRHPWQVLVPANLRPGTSLYVPQCGRNQFRRVS